MELQTLTHQNFGEIRFVELEGKRWYVVADVCHVLSIQNPSRVARSVHAANKKRLTVRTDMNREMLFVNANGLNQILNAVGTNNSEEIKQWLIGDVEEKSDVPQLLNLPEFGSFRWIMKEEDIWFVAVDVCRILDLGNASAAVSRLSDNERGIISINTQSGYQNMVIVNEPGLYRLIFASRKKEAKTFQDKVYHEILPAIRKYGYYSVNQDSQAVEPVVDKNKEEALRLKKQLSDLEKFEFAVVYVLLMSNGTVKIGMTKDLTERVKQLKAETGLYVLKFRTTPFMPREEAAELEAKLKEMFAAYCMGGEYFDVKFTLVCAALQ